MGRRNKSGDDKLDSVYPGRYGCLVNLRRIAAAARFERVQHMQKFGDIGAEPRLARLARALRLIGLFQHLIHLTSSLAEL